MIFVYSWFKVRKNIALSGIFFNHPFVIGIVVWIWVYLIFVYLVIAATICFSDLFMKFQEACKDFPFDFCQKIDPFPIMTASPFFWQTFLIGIFLSMNQSISSNHYPYILSALIPYSILKYIYMIWWQHRTYSNDRRKYSTINYNQVQN